MNNFYHLDFIKDIYPLLTTLILRIIRQSQVAINNNSTTDLWYLGVARYVWTSISGFCSNRLGFDLKHSVNTVKEYLQEDPKLTNNEMMIYNGRSTVAVG